MLFIIFLTLKQTVIIYLDKLIDILFFNTGFTGYIHSHKLLYLLISLYPVIVPSPKIISSSDGGIGRRSGLKIHRPQGCASSTLAPSTKTARGYIHRDVTSYFFVIFGFYSDVQVSFLYNPIFPTSILVNCFCSA